MNDFSLNFRALGPNSLRRKAEFLRLGADSPSCVRRIKARFCFDIRSYPSLLENSRQPTRNCWIAYDVHHGERTGALVWNLQAAAVHFIDADQFLAIAVGTGRDVIS